MSQIRKTIAEKQGIAYAIKSGTAIVTDVDMSKRIVTGMFSSYLFLDSDNDVLLPSCCAKSIQEHGPDSKGDVKIKHLLDHMWSCIPGKLQVLEETTKNGVQGVYFETKMVSSTLGNDTLINYQENIYDNHSIGFQYLDGKYLTDGESDWDKYVGMLVNPDAAKDAGYMFVWSQLKLWEGSTVAFGANSLTPYLGVKSGNPQALSIKINDRITLLQKQLTSGTQSDETMRNFNMELIQLKQLISELFDQQPDAKDILKKDRTEKPTLVPKKSLFAALNNPVKK